MTNKQGIVLLANVLGLIALVTIAGLVAIHQPEPLPEIRWWEDFEFTQKAHELYIKNAYSPWKTGDGAEAHRKRIKDIQDKAPLSPFNNTRRRENGLPSYPSLEELGLTELWEEHQAEKRRKSRQSP